MNKTLARLLVVLSLSWAAVAVATPVAASVDAMSDCSSTGFVCVYRDINFGGAPLKLYLTNSCRGLPSDWNDKISSLWNRFQSSGGKIKLYQNAGCGGISNSYAPNSSYSWVGLVYNDLFSSYWIGPGAP